MAEMSNLNTGVRLLSIFTKMTKEPKRSSDFSDIVYGQVISVAPLTIKIDNRNIISENMLVVGALCKQTIIKIPFPEKGQVKHQHQGVHGMTSMELPQIELWRGLNVGDKVIMIRFMQGQKYFILQRKEGIP